jgi:hypothetical protein
LTRGLNFDSLSGFDRPEVLYHNDCTYRSIMTVNELFERIQRVHAGETGASVGYNLELDPCPSWLLRLEWPDRFSLTMINFFLVKELRLRPAICCNPPQYAEEDNPIVTRYHRWRPNSGALGSYYSDHWYLEWTSAETGNAYQLHLLAAPRDSAVWIYAKFELDIFLTWGGEHLDGEDCHFMSPTLLQWHTLVDRIGAVESGAPVA